MSKQGEEYERFVQDVYKVLNANDGLSNAIVQHDVKLKGISREHQIDGILPLKQRNVTKTMYE